MKSTTSKGLVFIAIFIFAGVVGTVFDRTTFTDMVSQLSINDVIQNIIIGTGYFLSRGLVIKVIYKHHYNVNLPWQDTLLLPSMMHLFTYVLPMKGGLIFQTYFSKAKYGLDMSKGFSVGLLVFAASLIIASFIGGALSFLIRDALALQLLLLFMFGTLIFFLVAGKFVSEPDPSKTGFLNSLIAFVQKVLIQFREQLKDSKLLFRVIFVTLASTLVHAVWFYHCAYVLGYEPEPVGILLATLVLRIVTLVRILPGNLGVQEVMIGSVFLAAGLGLQEGLTTSLLVRLISVVLAGTLGIGGLYLNFRYFETDSITGLLNKLKRSDNQNG